MCLEFAYWYDTELLAINWVIVAWVGVSWDLLTFFKGGNRIALKYHSYKKAIAAAYADAPLELDKFGVYYINNSNMPVTVNVKLIGPKKKYINNQSPVAGVQ